MRLNAPRIAPVPEDQWTAEQKELAAPMLARGKMFNIFRTLLGHPDGMRAFMGWGNFILSKRNSLPKREREIVILRIGFLCRSGYEWAQHVEIGLRAGLTEAEISAIKQGAEAPGWSAADASLIRACDDLNREQFITEPNWQGLRAHFSERQCMDTVLTAAQYTQVSMLLNTFGVQLDDFLKGDPDLRRV
jgi:hypothetical protein